MKKKVSFFHPYFVYGGVEKTNISVAKYLLVQGYEVDFLALSFGDRLKPQMIELGIHMVELQAKRTGSAIGELRKYMQSTSEEYQLTVISCQNFANVVAVLSLPKNRENIKLILAERSNIEEIERSESGLKKFIIKSGMKLLFPKADCILANSKETAQDLKKLVKKDVRYIYNPIEIERHQKNAEETVELAWFKEKIPVLVSVGRLTEYKGFDVLIKALKQVRNNRDVRLIIVGDGEYREELESLIRQAELTEAVMLVGYDENPEKYMKRANAFVFASRFEGLPNVLIEAQALKVPCISTRCKSGPEEILLNGKAGYLVEVDDVDGMARAIIHVLENSNEVRQCVEYAYSGLDRFCPETIGKAYLRLIEE